ncbi:vanillate O-demethylase ferredoxin subunit [Pseudomonas sp. NFPP07]|uniref:PDR/VanB family oxidoreductase n=1 Tax=Pseudomonas sp. NFPP07 TaxID=1566213 RepID=UPI0008F1C3AE|nr:PDR/VanB family oxidoreductase [Pseudomonas sp. NFPP07]SFP76582.1 vanillate O-demethylase ferredoxin subunit [Pseudomonas sp. NFPP07]
MNYQITQCLMLSPSIKEITLAPLVPAPCETTAGAHFKWWIPTLEQWRHYSRVELAEHELPPGSLVFAIRLNPDSPSSAYIRQLKAGDPVRLDGPFNAFDYQLDDGDGADIALAGGIGITPLTGILRHLRAQQRPARLHYFAKSAGDAAYAAQMRELLQDSLSLHCSDSAEGRPSVAAVLGQLQPRDRLYVCGPQAMLNDVFSHAQSLGFPRERIHFEVFNTCLAEDDPGFAVHAADSGVDLRVQPGQSLLDALEEAGLEPLYDCRRGECGVCELDVLEGEVDHRDFIMSPQQAACSNKIYPCVSRAKSPSLKLVI